MARIVGELTVKIKSDVDGYTFEKIEDRIRDLLEEEGIEGEISCSVTGNTTLTRKEEMGKKEKGDISVRGKLILGEKIWFNDDLRCRLRICGFDREQVEKLRRAKFVDIAMINSGDVYKAVVYINEFGDDPIDSMEETEGDKVAGQDAEILVAQTINAEIIEKVRDIDDTYLVVEVQVDNGKFKKGDRVNVTIAK